MNFNMDQIVDKREYFLDNIQNQFNHEYYFIFLLTMSEMRRT